jgi:hypothetical protein
LENQDSDVGGEEMSLREREREREREITLLHLCLPFWLSKDWTMLAFTVEGGFPVQSTDSDANSSGDVPTHLPRNHVLSVI